MDNEEEVKWCRWHAIVVILGFKAFTKYVEHSRLCSCPLPALGPLLLHDRFATSIPTWRNTLGKEMWSRYLHALHT